MENQDITRAIVTVLNDKIQDEILAKGTLYQEEVVDPLITTLPGESGQRQSSKAMRIPL